MIIPGCSILVPSLFFLEIPLPRVGISNENHIHIFHSSSVTDIIPTKLQEIPNTKYQIPKSQKKTKKKKEAEKAKKEKISSPPPPKKILPPSIIHPRHIPQARNRPLLIPNILILPRQERPPAHLPPARKRRPEHHVHAQAQVVEESRRRRRGARDPMECRQARGCVLRRGRRWGRRSGYLERSAASVVDGRGLLVVGWG